MTIQHHPSDVILGAFAAQALDRGERMVIATHLKHCAHCRAFVRKIDPICGLMLDRVAPVPRDFARQQTVYAARAAGVAPIASVFSDINDEEGLTAYVKRERGLGFDGIGCIHPRQIPVVHRAMTPTEPEITRAVNVVRAAEDAEARGLGAVALGSKMVDPPVVKQAFRTVQLAIAAGALAADWHQEEGGAS